MFGNKEHAENWARNQLRTSFAKYAWILEIDPEEILNSNGKKLPIIDMKRVLENARDLIPIGVEEEWIEDEYLALYRIPGKAIVYKEKLYFEWW